MTRDTPSLSCMASTRAFAYLFGLCGHIRVYREPNTTVHGQSVCIYGVGKEARDGSDATHQGSAGVPEVSSLSAQACRPSTHRAHTFRTEPACGWSASLGTG